MFFFKNFTDLLIIINMCFKTILFIKRKQKNYKMIKTRNLTDVESNRYIDRRRRGPSWGNFKTHLGFRPHAGETTSPLCLRCPWGLGGMVAGPRPLVLDFVKIFM
jgi:hypothetical protein